MTDNVNATKVKRGGVGYGLFAIFLSLVAIGASGYLYYCGMQAQDAFRMEINAVKVSVANNGQLIQAQDNEVKSQLSLIESQIASNSQKASPNFLLLQVNELVSMANQSLIVYSDVKSALKLLAYASQVLSGSTDAQYVDIKNALANDITNLGQLQYADSMVLTSKINLIADQITNLPLVDDKNVGSVESKNVSVSYNNLNASSIWNKFWNNIKKDFKSLVLVSSTNSSKAIELLPEKEVIIRQNIRLYLLNARIALLQHDEDSWKFNLSNIDSNLKNYFAKTTLLSSVMANVDDLLKVEVSMSNANIDNTLKALNKLNSLQK